MFISAAGTAIVGAVAGNVIGGLFGNGGGGTAGGNAPPVYIPSNLAGQDQNFLWNQSMYGNLLQDQYANTVPYNESLFWNQQNNPYASGYQNVMNSVAGQYQSAAERAAAGSNAAWGNAQSANQWADAIRGGMYANAPAVQNSFNDQMAMGYQSNRMYDGLMGGLGSQAGNVRGMSDQLFGMGSQTGQLTNNALSFLGNQNVQGSINGVNGAMSAAEGVGQNTTNDLGSLIAALNGQGGQTFAGADQIRNLGQKYSGVVDQLTNQQLGFNNLVNNDAATLHALSGQAAGAAAGSAAMQGSQAGQALAGSNELFGMGAQAGALGDRLQSMQGGQYGNVSGAANNLYGAAQAIGNSAFDPQGALYRQNLSDLTNNVRAGEYARGIQMSPAGASVEADALGRFQNDWQNQQLARQTQGASAMAGASQAAQGMYDTYGSNLQGLQGNAINQVGAANQGALGVTGTYANNLNSTLGAGIGNAASGAKSGVGVMNDYTSGIAGLQGQGLGMLSGSQANAQNLTNNWANAIAGLEGQRMNTASQTLQNEIAGSAAGQSLAQNYVNSMLGAQAQGVNTSNAAAEGALGLSTNWSNALAGLNTGKNTNFQNLTNGATNMMEGWGNSQANINSSNAGTNAKNYATATTLDNAALQNWSQMASLPYNTNQTIYGNNVQALNNFNSGYSPLYSGFNQTMSNDLGYMFRGQQAQNLGWNQNLSNEMWQNKLGQQITGGGAFGNGNSLGNSLWGWLGNWQPNTSAPNYSNNYQPEGGDYGQYL